MRRSELFDDAVFEFLSRLQRDRPWLRDRYEPYLSELADALDTELGFAAPVSAMKDEYVRSWLEQLDPDERGLAKLIVSDFSSYLNRFDWIGQPPNDPEASG